MISANLIGEVYFFRVPLIYPTVTFAGLNTRSFIVWKNGKSKFVIERSAFFSKFLTVSRSDMIFAPQNWQYFEELLIDLLQALHGVINTREYSLKMSYLFSKLAKN